MIRIGNAIGRSISAVVAAALIAVVSDVPVGPHDARAAALDSENVVPATMDRNATGAFPADSYQLRPWLHGLPSADGGRGVVKPTSGSWPWPFSAAMGVLESHAGVGSKPGEAPLIQMNKESLVYQQNDQLVIRATATDRFDGYLYVDFIDNEGRVYHLFPTSLRPDNSVSAGSIVVVGGGPGGHPGDPKLMINPPYGTDMIMALSTPVSLFETPRPHVEPASAYLQALSEGLTGIGRKGFATTAAGSYVFITTGP